MVSLLLKLYIIIHIISNVFTVPLFSAIPLHNNKEFLISQKVISQEVWIFSAICRFLTYLQIAGAPTQRFSVTAVKFAVMIIRRLLGVTYKSLVRSWGCNFVTVKAGQAFFVVSEA